MCLGSENFRAFSATPLQCPYLALRYKTIIMAPETRKIRKISPSEAPSTDFRAPKRSTLEDLHRLPSWKPTLSEKVFIPDPRRSPETTHLWYDPPEQLTVLEYVNEVTRYDQGWWQVTPDQVQPLPDTWDVAPGLKSLVTTDSNGKRSLRSVLYNKRRLWVGQCTACEKHTLAPSTYFLRGHKCVHCTAQAIQPTGNNLFVAGRNPLGSQLFLVNARTNAEAEEVAKAQGFAWVTPIHASRRGRVIQLPVPPSKTERPPNSWPFVVGDAPPDFDRVDLQESWQDADGQEWAWYSPPYEVPEPPPTALENLVQFDDMF